MTMSIQMFILDHSDHILAFLFVVNNFLFLPDLPENYITIKKFKTTIGSKQFWQNKSLDFTPLIKVFSQGNGENQISEKL